MTIEDNKKYKLTGEQIKDLASRFGVLSGEIGDLSTLTTTDKTSAVAAINELGLALDGKQDVLTAGENITIEDESGALVISATDTTYSNFTGTDGTAAGVAGLVPAPATTDAGKFLKADGTWDTAGGGSGPTVVQTTGTSTTDVMSQNAVTSMVFADPATQSKIKIGAGTSSSEGTDGIEIGHYAGATGGNSVAIGVASNASDNGAVAIGQSSYASAPQSIFIGDKNGAGNGATGYASIGIGGGARSTGQGSVALGATSRATTKGQFDIGANDTYYGYNSSNYRLLTGLYDPQNAHDAATKGYVDPTTDSSAPTTATVGRLGQIQIDTTTATAYMCVAVDTVTPAYTWKQITA